MLRDIPFSHVRLLIGFLKVFFDADYSRVRYHYHFDFDLLTSAFLVLCMMPSSLLDTVRQHVSRSLIWPQPLRYS